MNEQRLRDAYAVFRDTFQTSMSYEQFRYKHLENPDVDTELVTFVEYDGDMPCGTNSFMGGALLCEGTAIPATYSCDVAVLPSCQGKGAFSKVTRRAMDACVDGRPAVIYATPNANSYRGFQKLGFTELGSLETWCAVLRPVNLAFRKLLRLEKKYPPFREEEITDQFGNCWSSSRTCPFTEEDLARINGRLGIHLCRSRGLFQWKIDNNRTSDFLYWKVTKDGQLLAYFLLQRDSPSSCVLCDWFLLASGGEGLFKTLRRRARAYGDLLRVPLVNPDSTESKALRTDGFAPRKCSLQPFMLYPTGVGEDAWQCMCQLRRWNIRYIDLDTILNPQ